MELPPSYEESLNHRVVSYPATGHYVTPIPESSDPPPEYTCHDDHGTVYNGQPTDRAARTLRHNESREASPADDKCIRMALPQIPTCLAVICCVLNCFLPGIGTMLAGVSVFCCARTDDLSKSQKCGTCGLGILMGLLQLITTPLLLVGWLWSIVWGCALLGANNSRYVEIEPMNHPRDGQRTMHASQSLPVRTQPTRTVIL